MIKNIKKYIKIIKEFIKEKVINFFIKTKTRSLEDGYIGLIISGLVLSFSFAIFLNFLLTSHILSSAEHVKMYEHFTNKILKINFLFSIFLYPKLTLCTFFVLESKLSMNIVNIKKQVHSQKESALSFYKFFGKLFGKAILIEMIILLTFWFNISMLEFVNDFFKSYTNVKFSHGIYVFLVSLFTSVMKLLITSIFVVLIIFIFLVLRYIYYLNQTKIELFIKNHSLINNIFKFFQHFSFRS